MDEFYEWMPGSLNTARIVPEGSGDSAYQELFRGDYENWDFPIAFRQTNKGKYCDLIIAGWPDLYLVSNKMVNAMSTYGLTGWKIFPADIVDRHGQAVLGYQGLSITGRCGPTNYDKPMVIYKRRVPNGPICKFYKGLFVGLDQWDGSDFFLPRGGYNAIATRRAYEAFRKEKISNICFTKLSEVEVSALVFEPVRARQKSAQGLW